MSVSSEVKQDYFLLSIGTGLFKSNPGSDDESLDEYTETEFQINLPIDSSLKLLSRTIFIEHRLASSVDLVGLQLWRGAFLLGDFILANPDLIKGKKVLELASGTGFTSVVAAGFAESVIATDVDRDNIMDILRINGNKNSEFIGNMSKFNVMEIDFFWNSWPASITDYLNHCQVILVADVVYNQDITRNFFKTLIKILTLSPKVTYIAIERRQHVDLSGAVVAPNFQHFLEEIERMKSTNPNIHVSRLEIDFAQCFSYSRVNELTLWRVESV